MKTFQKPAASQHEGIHPLISHRYSPRSFEAKAIPIEEITLLLEAARWAPSSMNAQPWRFFVTYKGDEMFEQVWHTLMEGNKPWAKNAQALIVTFIPKNEDPNANLIYAHDLGLAIGNMSLQAESLEIGVHQMGGFSKQKVSELFKVENALIPMTICALGYYGDPSTLDEPFQSREIATRNRKPLSELMIKP